jgi:hypothetical protein
MSTIPSATIQRSPKQISGDLDGRAVLLSIDNGKYYNMNPVATRIWALIEKPITIEALIATLLDEYEVDRATCEKEVQAFLAQLRQDKLLLPVE